MRNKVKNYLFFGGLSYQEFMQVQPIIRQTNHRTWTVLSFLCVLFFSSFVGSSIFISAVNPNMPLYFGMLFLSVFCLVCFSTIVKPDSRFLMLLIYLLNAAFMLFSILLGIISSPNELSVTVMVAMVVLPLLTTDRPIYTSILVLFSAITFMITCLFVKTGTTLALDIYNACSFCALAVIMNHYMSAYKLHSFYYQHIISCERDTDALTRVKNKTAFLRLRNTIDLQILNNEAAPFAIALCDINKLKVVNDNYGHEMGDLYLQSNCRCLCHIFEESDVFRIGGDEFVVFLEKDAYEQRDALLTQARAAVNNIMPNENNASELVNFSIGLAAFDSDTDKTFSDVLERADQNMYEHKQKMHRLCKA